MRPRSVSMIVLGVVGAAAPVLGVTPLVTTEYGYEFVTIGDVGNTPVPPELVNGSSQAGRGSVGYEYRMARTEVSTTEWVEFMDVVAKFDPQLARDFEPFTFGGYRDRAWPGPGERWIMSPGFERSFVRGISWRAAAMYCNWLHNDKAPTMVALQNGAYDASTFTTNPDGTFNDQLTHSPGARFWIPTLDEWLKASHYDPDRQGAGQGGWWMYPYASDTPPVSGWPDEPGAQTSRSTKALFDDQGYVIGIPEFDIPVGAYPDANAPWGMLDVSGGAGEWTEEAQVEEGVTYARFGAGSWVGAGGGTYWERLGMLGGGGTPDSFANFMGLRLASDVIPCPGSAMFFTIGIRRCRRKNYCDDKAI